MITFEAVCNIYVDSDLPQTAIKIGTNILGGSGARDFNCSFNLPITTRTITQINQSPSLFVR